MTRSKSGTMSGIPREQKCSFLIGPVSSWFMPNSIDLWTQPDGQRETTTASYFVYGSIGCFCLGEIHRVQHNITNESINALSSNGAGGAQSGSDRVGGIVNHIADVKNDKSRVACTRFQRNLPYPLVLVLTESGSLLIYDCLQRANLMLIRKAEILRRFVGIQDDDHPVGSAEERSSKRARFHITQQLNSCTWPDPKNIFLGVSLLNENTCMLLRLKLNDLSNIRDKLRDTDGQTKSEIFAGHQKIDLDLKDFTSPICLIESRMLDEKTCLIAVALDDGLIIVIKLDLENDRVLRTIKLKRHDNQICAMSLYPGDRNKFPLGLLASMSRDGLVILWNVENMFYFGDYLAFQNADRSLSSKINWFTLRFLELANWTYLAVSNVDSGITLLKLPENARSKIRLKEVNRDPKTKSKQSHNELSTLKHTALIFNMEYDPITKTLISTSLDGNLIIWSSTHEMPSISTELQMKPQFLIPALPDNARTHMLRHNPIKEDLLCLALGQAGLRFYCISNNLLNSRYDMSPSCSFVARKMLKANLKPTSIAWHPSHEYRLAIATLEGKVFRVDITPRKAATIEAEFKSIDLQQDKTQAKLSSLRNDILDVDYQPMDREDDESAPKASDQSKTGGIYSLCWGPNPASPCDVTKHAIYAVGSVSHRLFVFCSRNNKDSGEKLTNYLDEFGDTSLPEAMGQASEVAWKSSMDLMALGTTDGRVIILAYLDECHQERSNHKLFKQLATIQGHLGSSSVQCIAWHPTTDKDDPSYYKIAASSNESPALIFNLKEAILVADVKEQLRLEQLNKASDNGTCDMNLSAAYAENIVGSYVNTLKAHEKAITDIAWNPHRADQLATCSFDRTCYVWSIDNSLLDARVIAKFSARDRLFTLDWSLNDEDLIFTSGHDSVVWAWRPSENPFHLISV